jgi:type IV pilus assembly protein PilP
MNRHFTHIILLLFAMGTISGACGGDKPTKSPRAKKTAKISKEKVEKKAEETKEESVAEEARYVYNPTGKTDPFEPYIGAVQSDRAQPQTPLEKFDISQLTLTGVIWGLANSMAMVEDPNGKGYVVKVGTPIGKNMGKVIEIQQTKLVILEQYVDPVRGSVVRNRVYLELPRREGEF